MSQNQDPNQDSGADRALDAGEAVLEGAFNAAEAVADGTIEAAATVASGAADVASEAASGGCCFVDEVFDACYVATAAHGDLDAPEVVDLRLYRDQRLLVNPVGRGFTAFYYRYGPYPAAVIRRFPALRAPARQLLRPAVWWARRKITTPFR